MATISPIHWDPAVRGVDLLDQTRLPGAVVRVSCERVGQLVDAIDRLAVRGAPVLGVAGALGVALAMAQAEREHWDEATTQWNVDAIRNARPTAVNLAWGVDRVRPVMSQGLDAVLAAADDLVAEDRAANRALATRGADWIMQRLPRRPLRVLTHCNTGSLATTAEGTALGIIRELHARGALEVVYVDETRPLLQGARLTAWELGHDGIPYLLQVDAAAASTILRGMVDVAFVGADRIARDGDTANKIGTVGVALACDAAGIPFVVAAPASTVDLDTESGHEIHIELRPSLEVADVGGVATAPIGAPGFNPAFDVTPHRLISAIVSEHAVVEPTTVSDVSALVGAPLAGPA